MTRPANRILLAIAEVRQTQTFTVTVVPNASYRAQILETYGKAHGSAMSSPGWTTGLGITGVLVMVFVRMYKLAASSPFGAPASFAVVASPPAASAPEPPASVRRELASFSSTGDNPTERAFPPRNAAKVAAFVAHRRMIFPLPDGHDFPRLAQRKGAKAAPRGARKEPPAPDRVGSRKHPNAHPRFSRPALRLRHPRRSGSPADERQGGPGLSRRLGRPALRREGLQGGAEPHVQASRRVHRGAQGAKLARPAGHRKAVEARSRARRGRVAVDRGRHDSSPARGGGARARAYGISSTAC